MNIPNWAKPAHQSFFRTGTVAGARVEQLSPEEGAEVTDYLDQQFDELQQLDNSPLDLNPDVGVVEQANYARLQAEFSGAPGNFGFTLSLPGFYQQARRRGGESRLFNAQELYGQDWVKAATVNANGCGERLEKKVGGPHS